MCVYTVSLKRTSQNSRVHDCLMEVKSTISSTETNDTLSLEKMNRNRSEYTRRLHVLQKGSTTSSHYVHLSPRLRTIADKLDYRERPTRYAITYRRGGQLRQFGNVNGAAIESGDTEHHGGARELMST